MSYEENYDELKYLKLCEVIERYFEYHSVLHEV